MLTRKKNKQTNHSLGGNKGHVDSDRTGNKVTDGGLVQDEGRLIQGERKGKETIQQAQLSAAARRKSRDDEGQVCRVTRGRDAGEGGGSQLVSIDNIKYRCPVNKVYNNNNICRNKSTSDAYLKLLTNEYAF